MTPEKIWINWKEANRAHLAYDDPPEHDGQDCRDAYVRALPSPSHADLLAEALRLSEVKALVEAAEAVIARWDGPAWADLPHTQESIDRLRATLKGAGK